MFCLNAYESLIHKRKAKLYRAASSPADWPTWIYYPDYLPNEDNYLSLFLPVVNRDFSTFICHNFLLMTPSDEFAAQENRMSKFLIMILGGGVKK